MRRCASVALWSLAACFGDAPPVDEHDGSTTAEMCPVGAHQCACTSGGSCDAPWVCHAPSQTCIEDECDPGSEFCTCADGLCLEGLECSDELCVAPPPTATSSGTATSESTSESTNSTDASQGTGASGEVGPDDGDTGTDDACVQCLQESAADECAPTFASCLGTEDCNSFSMCVFAEQDVAACCGRYFVTPAWGAFIECATAMGTGECEVVCTGASTTC